MLVKSDVAKHVIRIPNESNLELVHIRVNNTIPATNIIGIYLPVESRTKVEETDKLMNDLTHIVDEILDRQETVILMGDFNRPLQSKKLSHGTKLLANWLMEDKVTILNDMTPTRIDPHNQGKSVLVLALVSTSIENN